MQGSKRTPVWSIFLEAYIFGGLWSKIDIDMDSDCQAIRSVGSLINTLNWRLYTMICRIWRGWARPDKAEAYQTLLTEEVMPGIYNRNIDGFVRHEALRRNSTDEAGARIIEFTTLLWFDSLEAIKAFVGDDPEIAHVPAKARALLLRFEERSIHYDVVDQGPKSIL